MARSPRPRVGAREARHRAWRDRCSSASVEIEFVGAARVVTGSKHVVRTSEATVLLDCGLFQGRRRESNERNRSLGVDPSAFDAVVLSHAHIDHSGALPILVKHGYRGPIYATPATRDLCAAMLVDAALIQDSDARYINRVIERDGADMERVEPLFGEEDVVRVLSQMVAVPCHRRQRIASGVDLTFHEAGHVLGSAVSAIDADGQRLVFTGDLGRPGVPLLRDAEVPEGADALIMESTYGDRVHPPIASMDDVLKAVVERTVARGGRIIIPSFALERTQELLYAWKRLRSTGRVPPVPVYVDSPLTVKITDVFKMHLECFDEEARALVRSHDSPFDLPELTYVTDVEDSKALDASDGPAIIISASGMCEGGRVVHHLKASIEDHRNTVLIVGFQAQHTLGRRIVERRPRVRIFGVERDLRAEVVVLNGFSAHADRRDLLAYAERTRARGNLRHVALVHGEAGAQDALAGDLRERGFADVRVPVPGDVLRV